MITREQFIDAVIASCAEIFEMVLPLKLSNRMNERPLPYNFQTASIKTDILAILGLTGHCSGLIQLSLPYDLSLKLAGWMMQETYNELNSEVFESIGELLNLIAGGLKNRLSSQELDIFEISIPFVISGQDKSVYHGTDKEYIFIPIDTDQGLFFITLVLDQNK